LGTLFHRELIAIADSCVVSPGLFPTRRIGLGYDGMIYCAVHGFYQEPMTKIELDLQNLFTPHASVRLPHAKFGKG
jgi:hypothetical protein